MTLHIFLDHGEAYQNLGDEAMLLAAIDKFRDRRPECTIVVPSTSPSLLPNQIGNDIKIVPSLNRLFTSLAPLYRTYSQNIYGKFMIDGTKITDALLRASYRLPRISQSQSELVDAIRSADIFYGVGGAYFNDYYPSGLGYKRWLYKQIPSSTASVLSAQGFGPLDNQWSRQVTKEAVSKLDLVTFRDNSYSDQIVSTLCPGVEKKIVGDEAFSLRTEDQEAVDDYLDMTGLSSHDEFIAFHYRSTDYTQSTSHLVEKLSNVIDALIEKIDLPVVFVPMSYGTHSGHDQRFGKQIAENVDSNEFYVGPECQNAKVVKGVLGQASLAVGLSYHFHVFALSQNVPSVVLYSGEYYRLKSEGLLGFYDFEDYVLNIEEESVSVVTEFCSRAISSDVEKSIAKVNDDLKGESSWTVDRALEMTP